DHRPTQPVKSSGLRDRVLRHEQKMQILRREVEAIDCDCDHDDEKTGKNPAANATTPEPRLSRQSSALREASPSAKKRGQHKDHVRIFSSVRVEPPLTTAGVTWRYDRLRGLGWLNPLECRAIEDEQQQLYRPKRACVWEREVLPHNEYNVILPHHLGAHHRPDDGLQVLRGAIVHVITRTERPSAASFSVFLWRAFHVEFCRGSLPFFNLDTRSGLFFMRDSRGLNIIRAGLLGLALALVASTLSGCGPCCCRGSWSTAVQGQWSDEGVRLEDPTELVALARQLKLRRKTLTTTFQTTTELLTTTTPSTSPAAAPGTTSATPASTELPTTASGSRWSSGILNQVSRIATGPPRSEVRPNLYDEPSYTTTPLSTTMAASTTTPPLSTRAYYSTTPQQTTQTSSSTTPQQTIETSSSTTLQQTTETSHSTTPPYTTRSAYRPRRRPYPATRPGRGVMNSHGRVTTAEPMSHYRPGRRKSRKEPPSIRWSGLSDTPQPGDNQECSIEDGEYSAVLRKSLVNARGCFRATLQLQCGPMGTRSVSLKIMRRETFWKAAFRTMYVRQI
ncbi:hypothetical protein FOZ63_031069, partial [Perkinsus olseni]